MYIRLAIHIHLKDEEMETLQEWQSAENEFVHMATGSIIMTHRQFQQNKTALYYDHPELQDLIERTEQLVEYQDIRDLIVFYD